MAEFLSSTDRAAIAANLLNLHDTFGREIIVYDFQLGNTL